MLIETDVGEKADYQNYWSSESGVMWNGKVHH